MKNYLILLICIVLISCKNKEPKITHTIELSQEMMDYFVNYDVGTKWIYQDTLDENNFDTIELVSKLESNRNVRGTLYKGYMLDYLPKKSKNFQVRINSSINNSSYVNVDPMVTASGQIKFHYYENKWAPKVTYYDSIEIKGNKYYKLINSKSSNSFQQDMSIALDYGIICFWKTRGPGVLESYFILIKIIKP